MDGMVVFDERDYSCDREDNACRVKNLKIYMGKKKLNYCLIKAQYSSKNFTHLPHRFRPVSRKECSQYFSDYATQCIVFYTIVCSKREYKCYLSERKKNFSIRIVVFFSQSK